MKSNEACRVRQSNSTTDSYDVKCVLYWRDLTPTANRYLDVAD